MNWDRTQIEPRPEAEEEPRKYTRRQMLGYTASTIATALSVQSNVEAGEIDVTRHTTVLPKLKRAMRVVQISDVHRSQFVPEHYVEHVAATASALNPDLVLLTGDFVTRTAKYADSCVKMLARIKSPLGAYAVLGNHDYWCDEATGGPFVADTLEDAGIPVLVNRSIKLRNGVRLVGIDDVRAGVPRYDLGFAQVRPEEPVIAMTHNPGAFFAMSRHECLTLAGHTHGGQIYVPGFSEVFVRTPFLRGWYSLQDRPGRLYVSRGLGTIHVPMRLGSTPEISVFDLNPA